MVLELDHGDKLAVCNSDPHQSSSSYSIASLVSFCQDISIALSEIFHDQLNVLWREHEAEYRFEKLLWNKRADALF